jgi:hypothetical protein
VEPGEVRSVHKILVKIILRKKSLGRPRVNGRTILKCILNSTLDCGQI